MPVFAPDQLAATQKNSVADWFALAQTVFTGFHRMTGLNLQTAQATFGKSQERMQAILAGKDLREILAVQTGIAPQAVDEASAYAAQMFEIAVATQAEFARLAEAQFQQQSRHGQAFLDQLIRQAPAGSEAATAMLQAAVAAANDTYDAVQKGATQAARLAQSRFSNANAAVKGAAQRAAA